MGSIESSNSPLLYIPFSLSKTPNPKLSLFPLQLFLKPLTLKTPKPSSSKWAQTWFSTSPSKTPPSKFHPHPPPPPSPPPLPLPRPKPPHPKPKFLLSLSLAPETVTPRWTAAAAASECRRSAQPAYSSWRANWVIAPTARPSSGYSDKPSLQSSPPLAPAQSLPPPPPLRPRLSPPLLTPSLAGFSHSRPWAAGLQCSLWLSRSHHSSRAVDSTCVSLWDWITPRRVMSIGTCRSRRCCCSRRRRRRRRRNREKRFLETKYIINSLIQLLYMDMFILRSSILLWFWVF